MLDTTAPKTRMPNEEDESIINLAASLLRTAMGCAEYFEKNCGRTLDSEQFAQGVREFIYIFVHFTDRYSFEMYGDQKRNRITDSLVYLLDQILHEDYGKFKAADHVGSGITMVRGIDTESLSNRNVEYAMFRSGKSSEEAEESANNVLFSFGERLSQIARGIPHDFPCTDLGKGF